MKVIDRRSLIRELLDAGYEYVRSAGSHDIYKLGTSTIPVPLHLNPCIAIRLTKEIKKQKGN